MRNTYARVFIIILMTILLTGCLYPTGELSQNQLPNEDQLELVQSAIEKYKIETNGLVPIKTKTSDTSIFEKYLIDFHLLMEKQLLSSIPGNAFEKGGIYKYTLITPEDNPRVKLIDLRITEAIRKVNVQLDIYRSKNTYPPFGQEIEDGLYLINHKKLGLKNEPYVISPYTNNNLPIIMDTEGQLYVDYRIDLNTALEDYDHEFVEGDDIRYLLADNTPFAPVYSLPYTIHDGTPVFFIENK